MHRHQDAMVKWKEQLQFKCKELFGIDGEPFEVDWHIFPGHTAVGSLREIQKRMTVRGTRPEEFEDRIIFMSMFNGIDWTENGYYEGWYSNAETVREHARTFPLVQWSSLGLGEEEKWHGTQISKFEGQWSSTANVMVSLQFPRQRSSILQSFQSVGSGILEKTKVGKYDSLQCGSSECRSLISND